MAPAQQAFEADHAAFADVHDRLVVQIDFAALDRHRQIAGQLQLLGAFIRQAAGEEAYVIAAFGLDLVHRAVGAADQRGCVVGVDGCDRHADAGRQEVGAVGQHQRLFDLGQHGARDAFDFAAVIELREQRDEFVAAHAADDILRAHRLAHAPRHFDQRLVAGGVAQRVIDQLVAVEIDVQQRRALIGLEPRVELLQQVCAVRQARQRIVLRSVRQAQLGVFALQIHRQRARQRLGGLLQEQLAVERHRAEEQQQAHRLAALVADRCQERRFRAQRARVVALHERGVLLQVGDPGMAVFAPAGSLGAVFVRGQHGRQFAHHLAEGGVPPALADLQAGGLAHQMHAAQPAELAAQRDDDRGDDAPGFVLLAHDRGNVAFDLQQHALLLFARDVAARTAIADEAAGVIEYRPAVQRQVKDVALAVDLAELEVFERLVGLADGAVRIPVGAQEVAFGVFPATAPEQRAAPRAEHRIDRFRQVGKPVLRIGFPDPVGTQMRQIAKLGFAGGQLLLHGAHAGDVLHDAGQPQRHALRVALGAADAAHPDHVARGLDPAVFDA